jgi:hypothetical protein
VGYWIEGVVTKMISLTKQGTHYKYNGPEFNKDLSSIDKLERIEITCTILNFNIYSGGPYAKFPLFSLNLKELILIGYIDSPLIINLSGLKNLEKLEIVNPMAPYNTDINISGCINLLYFKCLNYYPCGVLPGGGTYTNNSADVSQCLKLEYYHTSTANPDLSKCKKLKYVDCNWYNGIECLFSCYTLEILILNGSYSSTLTGCLNLSSCLNLKYIEVNNNNIQKPFNMPNISTCTKLTHFKCYGNAILPDLTQCVNLKHFEYKGCYPLPDLSQCSNLDYFDYKGDYSLPNLSHCKNIKIIYNGIQQEDHRQIQFEKETTHKFEQLELFHIEEKFHRNDILSKIEERFNKLEEENKRLYKIIDELRPTKSKYM